MILINGKPMKMYDACKEVLHLAEDHQEVIVLRCKGKPTRSERKRLLSLRATNN